MKKSGIGILIGLFAISVLNAQETGDNARRWEQGRLTWDDFSKRSSNNGKNAELHYYFTCDPDQMTVHDTIVSFMAVNTHVDRDSSWVDMQKMNELELHYQQVLFDLAEIESRLLQQKVNRLSKPSEMDSCIRNGVERLEQTCELFRTSSRQGTDADVVTKWGKDVRERLQATEAEMQKIPGFRPATFGFGAGVGIGAHLFTGDLQRYFQPNGEVAFHLEFAAGRSELMLHAGLGGTKVRLDSFVLNGERWSSSDHLEFCQLSAAYGFRILERKKIRLTPFVGYGTTEISTISGQNDEVKHNMKTGGFLGGICTDYLLRTSLSISPSYLSTKECHTIALRAKAYVAQSDFYEEMKGLSIHFSLSVSIFDRFVRLE